MYKSKLLVLAYTCQSCRIRRATQISLARIHTCGMYGHALGALPLDVYTVIFRALEYESLRDTCRALNRTLRRCAERVLEERREDVQLDAHVPHAAPREVYFHREEPFWRDRLECACRSEQQICDCGFCSVKVRSVATLRYGGFLALVEQRACRCVSALDASSGVRFALAAYNARCAMQRVVSLHDAVLHSSGTVHAAVLCAALTRVLYMYAEPQDNHCVTLVAYPSDDEAACGIAAHWFRYRRAQHTLQWEQVRAPMDASAARTILHAASVCAAVAADDDDADRTDVLLLCCRRETLPASPGDLYPVEVLHVRLRAQTVASSIAHDAVQVPHVTHRCALEMDADLFARDALCRWSGLRQQAVLDTTGALVFVADRYRDQGSVLLRFDARSGALLQRVPVGRCGAHAQRLVQQSPYKRDFYIDRLDLQHDHGCTSSTRCSIEHAMPSRQQQHVYRYTALETDPLACNVLHGSLRGDDGHLVRVITSNQRMIVYKRAWRMARAVPL